MIIVKNEKEIAGIREAGRVAARVRDAVVGKVSPGITTAELAEYAAGFMREAGAESAFLNYRGYPGIICVSVNEEVVHGIPGSRRIALGDLVSVDIGVRYKGFVGDTARTVLVGVNDPALVRLAATAESALTAAISKAVAGNRVGDISNAVETTATAAGFSVVRQFVGHGIGRNMHEAPEVPNFGQAGKGPRLRAGMTLAIEPMVNMGGWEVDVLEDGWTVRTRDGKPSVHCEHMVVVREGTAEVLTSR